MSTQPAELPKALAAALQGQKLDHLRRVLLLRTRRALTPPGFRASAVLVPLLLPLAVINAPPEVLFIVRHRGLPTHAGQIAFPGGKRDPEDPSLEHTALRESAEELGLSPPDIHLLGRLDDVLSPAGFVVTPIVGAMLAPVALSPNLHEVAETFCVPLPALPTVYRAAGTREWQGYKYKMHEFLYEQRRIWGVTAAIVRQLLDLLPDLGAPPVSNEEIQAR